MEDELRGTSKRHSQYGLSVMVRVPLDTAVGCAAVALGDV